MFVCLFVFVFVLFYCCCCFFFLSVSSNKPDVTSDWFFFFFDLQAVRKGPTKPRLSVRYPWLSKSRNQGAGSLSIRPAEARYIWRYVTWGIFFFPVHIFWRLPCHTQRFDVEQFNLICLVSIQPMRMIQNYPKVHIRQSLGVHAKKKKKKEKKKLCNKLIPK